MLLGLHCQVDPVPRFTFFQSSLAADHPFCVTAAQFVSVPVTAPAETAGGIRPRQVPPW